MPTQFSPVYQIASLNLAPRVAHLLAPRLLLCVGAQRQFGRASSSSFVETLRNLQNSVRILAGSVERKGLSY